MCSSRFTAAAFLKHDAVHLHVLADTAQASSLSLWTSPHTEICTEACVCVSLWTKKGIARLFCRHPLESCFLKQFCRCYKWPRLAVRLALTSSLRGQVWFRKKKRDFIFCCVKRRSRTNKKEATGRKDCCHNSHASWPFNSTRAHTYSSTSTTSIQKKRKHGDTRVAAAVAATKSS